MIDLIFGVLCAFLMTGIAIVSIMLFSEFLDWLDEFKKKRGKGK